MFVQGSAFKGNLRWPESFQSEYWQVNDTIANFMGLEECRVVLHMLWLLRVISQPGTPKPVGVTMNFSLLVLIGVLLCWRCLEDGERRRCSVNVPPSMDVEEAYLNP